MFEKENLDRKKQTNKKTKNRCFGETLIFHNGCEKIESFLYWDKVINVLALVLRELIWSFREGDWSLRLSSVYRAIPIYFPFDRINYKRCLLLYYEDCLALEQKYPGIHASFLKGDFVDQHSCKKVRKGLKSLEKAYNKPAKNPMAATEFYCCLDTQRRFNVDTTSYRRWNDIVCLRGSIKNVLFWDALSLVSTVEYHLFCDLLFLNPRLHIKIDQYEISFSTIIYNFTIFIGTDFWPNQNLDWKLPLSWIQDGKQPTTNQNVLSSFSRNWIITYTWS